MVDHEPDMGLRPPLRSKDAAYDESSDLILDQDPAPFEFGSLFNGEWRYKIPKWWSFFKVSPTFGLLLVGMSGVTYGCQSAAIKYLQRLPTVQVIWVRFLVVLTVSFILCAAKGEPVFKKVTARWEIFFRCMFGIMSFLCSTFAFQRLPVGEVTVIISIAPIFTAIGSKIILKDKFKPVHFVCIILCVGGVIMVVDPKRLVNHASLDILAVSVALMQPIFKSLAYIFIKRCNNQGIEYHVVLFYYALSGFSAASLSIVVTGFFLVISGKPLDNVVMVPNGSDNMALLCAGLLGFLAQYGINKGGMLANTTKCSLVRNVDVVVAFLFQIFMFQEVPSIIQVVGSIVLLSSTVLVVVWKDKEQRLS